VKDSEQLKQFLKEYKEYVTNVLKPTREEIKALLKQWRQPGYWAKYTKKSRLPDPSPIQRVFLRIKRPESVVDKIIRKPSDFPNALCSKSFRSMNDAIGARAIVYFMSHLPLIDRELRDLEQIEISKEYPPVAYLTEDLTKRLSLTHLKRLDKESGYASIHYLVRLRESAVPKDDRPWCELQVRTLAEDLWGEVEHILGYKPDKRTSLAVKKQFQILSRQLTSIDEHFNFLYEELLRFQEEVTFKDTDPLNAENLPPVLSEIGIGCAQQEIDGLLKLLYSRGVGTIGNLRKIATPRRLEVIRNTYRCEKGRAPINFEVTANLATLNGSEEGEEEIKLIKAQIAYLDAWDTLKKSFT
jgi:putative GTP pyrophosphokinase